MIPELIYREERHENYPLLFILGLSSGILGFKIAELVFPSQTSVLAVAFAAIPLVYPLTRSFLEDEQKGRPHIGEIFQYSSIFLGQAVAFFLLIFLVNPENLGVQISQFSLELQMMGIETVSDTPMTDITGQAGSVAGFISILVNNLTVFSVILVVSALISSSGAFILTWNASVLGVFLGVLAKNLKVDEIITGTDSVATPLAYIPHATIEMGGFIIAGIAGSLISAAIYRKHFDRETWIDYIKLIGLGAGLIILAAFLETA